MSELRTGEPLAADDRRLAATLRGALEARDASARTPRFMDLWPATSERSRLRAWRPAFAAGALAAVAVVSSWDWIANEPPRAAPGLDPALAHELSSVDFWRVPTDELLAHAAPSSPVLPSPPGLEFSLEESLL